MPITLPATVTGTTTGPIEFQEFSFTLTDVAKVDIHLVVNDFTDTSEQSAIAIKVRSTTNDVNHTFVSSHVDTSTTTDPRQVSDWLFPGEYIVLLSRSSYGQASIDMPVHAYTFTIGFTLPPVVTASCTPPKDSLSTTDVILAPECNAWCKRLAACKTACNIGACDIEVGQCAASTREYLGCIATTGEVQCIDNGAGPGYGLSHSCEYDPSVCAPGTIREP